MYHKRYVHYVCIAWYCIIPITWATSKVLMVAEKPSIAATLTEALTKTSTLAKYVRHLEWFEDLLNTSVYISYKCWSVRFLMSHKCAKVNVCVDIEFAPQLIQYFLSCLRFPSHFSKTNLFDVKHMLMFTTLNWSMVWPLWDSSSLIPFRNKVGLVPIPKWCSEAKRDVTQFTSWGTPADMAGQTGVLHPSETTDRMMKGFQEVFWRIAGLQIWQVRPVRDPTFPS